MKIKSLSLSLLLSFFIYICRSTDIFFSVSIAAAVTDESLVFSLVAPYDCKMSCLLYSPKINHGYSLKLF